MLSSSVLPGDVPGVAELDVTFSAGRGFKSRARALLRPSFAAEKDGRNGRGTREQISKNIAAQGRACASDSNRRVAMLRQARSL